MESDMTNLLTPERSTFTVPVAAYEVSLPGGPVHEVAGIAFPLETSDRRPGIWFEDGEITFFDYSVYAFDAFDWQLHAPDFGGRLQFMWQHGFDGGMSGIPIGNVTGLRRAATTEITFRAQFNDTMAAVEVSKAVGAGSVKQVSTMVLPHETTFIDDGDLRVRRVTRAEFLDVSLVVHAHFAEARILEANCAGCQTNALNGLPTAPSNEKPELARDVVEVSREYLGELHARLNDLETELRLAQPPETIPVSK